MTAQKRGASVAIVLGAITLALLLAFTIIAVADAGWATWAILHAIGWWAAACAIGTAVAILVAQ